MKRPWSLIDVRSFKDGPLQQEPSGEWIPARPMRYFGHWNDLKLAWWVLCHRAEAVVWPAAPAEEETK